MTKSLETLSKRLARAAEVWGAKSRLREKAGLSGSQLDGYIAQTNSPTLDVLDRIASALEVVAWQLIAPEDMPAAKVAPDLLEMLANASPEALQLVRLTLERFALGREEHAVSGQASQKSGNLFKDVKKKRP